MPTDEQSLSAESLRQALVDHLVERGSVCDSRIESAFRTVPRHLFLPQTNLEMVYSDAPIPVKKDDTGRVVSSSSQPTMMAIMLEQLNLQEGQNILEIGTATGYNAAILQTLVGHTGTVTSLELDHDLAQQAVDNLHRAGMSAINVVEVDASQGYSPRATYDNILSTVGVWDVPITWTQQLKSGGKLIVPIWLDGVQVSAAFIEQNDGTFLSEDNRPCAFVYLRGDSAGPNIQKQIGSSALYLLADEIDKIDTAALHLLLSDDHEINILGQNMNPADYWQGFQLYMMLNEPKDYIFAVFHIQEGQKAYGMEKGGIALFAPASAAFAPYLFKGRVHTFGGSDAFLLLQETYETWNKMGRADAQRLRVRLIPKSIGEIRVAQGKLYHRRHHYLHVWFDDYC